MREYLCIYTIIVFVIILIIPIVLGLWGFLDSQYKSRYTYKYKPTDCYFYINDELIPIYSILYHKTKNVFDDIPVLDNIIYVKEKEKFIVPKHIRGNMKIETFSRKGLHHDLIKSIKRCTCVIIKYGNGKSAVAEKII